MNFKWPLEGRIKIYHVGNMEKETPVKAWRFILEYFGYCWSERYERIVAGDDGEMDEGQDAEGLPAMLWSLGLVLRTWRSY